MQWKVASWSCLVWRGTPKGAWKTAMSLIKDCDVLVSVGTSGIVTPASDLPDIAFGLYKTVIHVNTIDQGVGEHELNEISLVGKATEVLTRLYSMMSKRSRHNEIVSVDAREAKRDRANFWSLGRLCD